MFHITLQTSFILGEQKKDSMKWPMLGIGKCQELNTPEKNTKSEMYSSV